MTVASNDPVCVLVGVGQGLGLSLAHKFGREGCRMALIARGGDTLADNVATLRDEGISAEAFPADVVDLESLDRAFAAIGDSFWPPTIIIYNAVSVTLLPPSELTVDTFVRDFTVNAAGALAVVHRAAPAMRTAGGGTILFSSAGVGVEPHPDWTSYAASKAALRNLAFSLAAMLANDNIHVATVTIGGHIERGGKLDPDRLAAEYWRLHTQKKDEWERELVVP